MGSTELGADAASGWDVVRPRGGALFDGLEVVGYRSRPAVGLDMRVIPQPAVVVVIELGTDALTVEQTTGGRMLSSLVAGLSPGRTRIRGDRVDCVEVRMSPVVAYSTLGLSLSDLDGGVVALEDVWGRDEPSLRQRLASAGTWDERFALTNGLLASRRASARSMDPEVIGSWERIVASRGRVRVGDLAASCGWSRKRLWSRFGAQVGLTPKRAAMLVRFDRAVEGLASGRAGAEVAAVCGYADQSHLHRDVSAFTGCTPGALIAQARSDTDTAVDAGDVGGPATGTFVQDDAR